MENCCAKRPCCQDFYRELSPLAHDLGGRAVSEREVAEYGGDTSGWVDIPGATLSITSDGAGVNFTVPAAEI